MRVRRLSASVRRALIAFLVLGCVILFAHAALRVGVAWALAYAPNGGGIGGTSRADPGPAEEAELRVVVGPPEATIAAYLRSPPTEGEVRGTIVLLHGIRLDHRALAGFAEDFAAHGYRAVLVDLRGHGASSGTHLTYGELEAGDVSRVLDVLGARMRLGPVFVFGHSYGGAVALHVAANDARVMGVVAVSTFASVRRVVSDYERAYLPGFEPWIPDSWLDDAVSDAASLADFDPEHSPERAAARIRAPLLLLHGGADTQVPPAHARILAAAGNSAKLVLLPGETHDSVIARARPIVAANALSWFDTLSSGSASVRHGTHHDVRVGSK
jgi:pimeloyl-ACP methyl ester carboxylesterase